MAAARPAKAPASRAKPTAQATATRKMTKAEIETFFSHLQALNPHPTTELEYASPYQLLVAVVLSAQATDKSVNLATRRLFRLAPTPQDMARLSEDDISDAIRTIGLYRNKAKNVHALTRILLEQHGGQVPHDRAALEALPGVGRKTANVILNTVFGDPVIAVDTHIFRLGNRTGLAPGKDVVAVEQALMRRVPASYLHDAHHWLILHGRYTCTARAPRCADCVVWETCHWTEKPPAHVQP